MRVALVALFLLNHLIMGSITFIIINKQVYLAP